MKKIVILSGAGLDAESGIPTFRDSKHGLWYNYKVDEVATIDGLNSNPEKVFEFHNMLRSKLKKCEPNDAHRALVKLEDTFDVVHITQNISDMLERAGAKNILHLHGELFKARSRKNPNTLYEWHGDLFIDDKGEDGSRLRPHTVLFGEYPYNIDEAYEAINKADILIIIGTSLEIGYIPKLIGATHEMCKIYYVDPNPSNQLKYFRIPIKYIKKKAVDGITKLVKKLIKEYESDNI
jgi:NAD-dependent deacetylase